MNSLGSCTLDAVLQSCGSETGIEVCFAASAAPAQHAWGGGSLGVCAIVDKASCHRLRLMAVSLHIAQHLCPVTEDKRLGVASAGQLTWGQLPQITDCLPMQLGAKAAWSKWVIRQLAAFQHER